MDNDPLELLYPDVAFVVVAAVVAVVIGVAVENLGDVATSTSRSRPRSMRRGQAAIAAPRRRADRRQSVVTS
ncbi:hypothetical protein M0802_013690 [Mischocyttarus mexicanus]|nr:hypothetical protein M0802_013690 [Mischocyttarus mexicanus]